MDKAEATVGAMQAARDRAKLYLDYTQVTAPVTGRISRRFVDPGNLINADTTVLTTIVTEDPMYAYFDVDERTYLDLLATIAPGKTSWYEGLKLPVLMRLANENDFEKVGQSRFRGQPRRRHHRARSACAACSTIASGLLKAGLVRAHPPAARHRPIKRWSIPDEAILSDQERKYVWVVNAKNEVEYRSVSSARPLSELRVIRPPEKGKEGKEGLRLKTIRSSSAACSACAKGQVVVEKRVTRPPTPAICRWCKLFAREPDSRRSNGQ